jgi:hypothetical protein
MRTQYGFCFRPALGRPGYREEIPPGEVMLWVNHRGATCYISRYQVHQAEWDALSGSLVPPADNQRRARELDRFSSGMKRDLRRMTALVRRLDPQERLTARRIIEMWEQETIEHLRRPLRAAQ